MSERPADAALNYLQQCQAELPESAARFQECADLYQRKLWHQLTVLIESTIEEVPEFTKGDFLIRFYDGFVASFGHRLNLLTLAKIAVRAARQFHDPSEAGQSVHHTQWVGQSLVSGHQKLICTL